MQALYGKKIHIILAAWKNSENILMKKTYFKFSYEVI